MGFIITVNNVELCPCYCYGVFKCLFWGNSPCPVGCLCIGNVFDGPCRISYRYAVRGDVVDHYAAGADGDVVADGDPRKDGDATANPTVVADGDGLCPFLPRVAFRRVGAVTGGVDADVRADEAVIADGDEGLVKDGEAEVGKEAFAHTDVLAVVAVEWLVDEGVFVGLSEYALQKGVAFLQQGGAHPVVLPAEVFHFVEFPDEFPVVGLIYEAGGHFFLFCHSAIGVGGSGPTAKVMKKPVTGAKMRDGNRR